MLKGIRSRILALVLIPLGFILYSEALKAPFVYDDRSYIIYNNAIQSLSGPDPLGTRYIGLLSFAINYRISGLTSFDFHLVNIIIHIINAILVFYLILFTFETPLFKRFSNDSGARESAGIAAAFISSVIFISHPVETQAVTYITQRFTSLAVLFYLASVLFYIKAKLLWHESEAGKRTNLFYAASIISAVLAMKTKEISFTIPFVVILYEFIFFGVGKDRRNVLSRIPFYFLLLLIPLMLFVHEGANADPVSDLLRRLQVKEAATLSRKTYILTQFSVIVTYLRLLFYPAGQKIDYDYPISHSLFEPGTLLSLSLLLVILGASAYTLIRSYRGRNALGVLSAFGVFWFFITLSVESFLVPIQDVIFEQRAYLPSIGIIISFTSGALYLFGRLRRYTPSLSEAGAAIIILALVSPPLFAAVCKRNIVWNDELKLINETIGESTRKGRLYYVRAMVYVDRKMYDKAIEDSATALGFEKTPEAYNIRGFAYSALMKYPESIMDFTKAIAVDPTYFLAYYNRGHSLMYLKKYREAISDYSKAINLRPDMGSAYSDRGIARTYIGEYEGALSDFNAACSLGNGDGCHNLKIFLEKKSKLKWTITKKYSPVYCSLLSACCFLAFWMTNFPF